MSNLNILNYRTIELLGEGGMGKVYLAEDTMLEKKVALKVLNVELSSEIQFIERFKQEAKIQSKLVHPNIVTLHNLLKDNNTYFIVMEYAEGITLKELIKRTGPINESRALKVLIQALEAVGYAHSRNIIHRDLKPSNMMISYNDEVKIMDFGIAKLLGERGLTGTGSKVGTLYYMSPEQIEKPKEVDYRTDLYSLGIVLFEMVTGQLPYNIDTESDFKLMNEIVNNPLPDPRTIYPHISDKTLEMIKILTQKNRNQRFSNCAQCVNFAKYGKLFDEKEIKSQEEERTIITPKVTDKTELAEKKPVIEPVKHTISAAPSPPPPPPPPIPPPPVSEAIKPEIKTPESGLPQQPAANVPLSTPVKSNIPVAEKPKKKTGFIVAAGIVIFLLAAFAVVKFVILDSEETPVIKGSNESVQQKIPDSNKVNEMMNNYLKNLYGDKNTVDSSVRKGDNFNFVQPSNEKFDSKKYNPYSDSYQKNSLEYSGFNLTEFSENKFKGQYLLANEEWNIVAVISCDINKDIIFIKDLNYSSLLFVGKEEEKPEIKTTQIKPKITNKPNEKKPERRDDKPPINRSTNTTVRPPH